MPKTSKPVHQESVKMVPTTSPIRVVVDCIYNYQQYGDEVVNMYNKDPKDPRCYLWIIVLKSEGGYSFTLPIRFTTQAAAEEYSAEMLRLFNRMVNDPASIVFVLEVGRYIAGPPKTKEERLLARKEYLAKKFGSNVKGESENSPF